MAVPGPTQRMWSPLYAPRLLEDVFLCPSGNPDAFHLSELPYQYPGASHVQLGDVQFPS